jgi:hypothetical protein
MFLILEHSYKQCIWFFWILQAPQIAGKIFRNTMATQFITPHTHAHSKSATPWHIIHYSALDILPSLHYCYISLLLHHFYIILGFQ